MHETVRNLAQQEEQQRQVRAQTIESQAAGRVFATLVDDTPAEDDPSASLEDVLNSIKKRAAAQVEALWGSLDGV